MRNFRSGKFTREGVIGPLRAFCPEEALLSLTDVDLDRLAAAGKKLVLVDIDNTLLPWRSEEIPQETQHWIQHGLDIGLRFCIISNTRHPARRDRIAATLGIDVVEGRFKPARHMYLQALDRFQVSAKEAVMIGDQLLTDVLGANRAGIEAIFVKPIHRREFVGTKFNRFIEWILRTLLYNSLEDSAVESELRRSGFFGNTIVRQFIKFCIVGGISTVIDLGLHYLLMFVFRFDGKPISASVGEWVLQNFRPGAAMDEKSISAAAFPVLKIVPVVLAILNSYYWNRRWTFKIKGSEGQSKQIVKFFTIALIGMALNVLISSSLNSIIPGHPRQSWAIASAIAMVIVVFWNFTGQRLWTFGDALKPEAKSSVG